MENPFSSKSANQCGGCQLWRDSGLYNCAEEMALPYECEKLKIDLLISLSAIYHSKVSLYI